MTRSARLRKVLPDSSKRIEGGRRDGIGKRPTERRSWRGSPRPVEEQEGLKTVRPGFAIWAVTDEGQGAGNEGKDFRGI